jgi:hypothetical protein
MRMMSPDYAKLRPSWRVAARLSMPSLARLTAQ